MPTSPLQVVCAVIFEDGKVLAARRDPGRSFPLKWEFPGGKQESDESPEMALHRELEEELEFKVRIVRPLEPVPFRRDGHCLDLIPFVCRPDQAHGPRPVDHVEIRWLPPGDLERLEWAPADVPILPQIPGLLEQLVD